HIQLPKEVGMVDGQPLLHRPTPSGLGLRLAGVVMGAVGLLFLAFVLIYAMLQAGSKDSDKDEQGEGVVEHHTEEPVSGQKRSSEDVREQRATDQTSTSKLVIPFDALGAKVMLDKIKVVRIEGSVSFVGSTQINNMVLCWESLNRFKDIETYPSGRV